MFYGVEQTSNLQNLGTVVIEFTQKKDLQAWLREPQLPREDGFIPMRYGWFLEAPVMQ